MKEDVDQAIVGWLPKFGLPRPSPSDPKDLRGQSIRVGKFDDEDTVRFFFPRRTLTFHQRMVKKLVGTLRKRGAKIESVHLTIDDYTSWIAVTGERDTPQFRYQFATTPPEL